MATRIMRRPIRVHEPMPMKYLHELLSRVLAGETPRMILDGLTPQNKGHTGEALLRILVLLGIHPTNTASFVTPYRSDVAARRLESIRGVDRLDILQTGLINAGGSNKIDVCWRDGSMIAVCSSKIGMIQVKSIADLEIGAMLTEFTESGGQTENGKQIPRESVMPYVLVDNKHDVLCLAEKSKASNKVSKDNLNPLDMEDLHRMCAVLLERIAPCLSNDVETILGHLLSDVKPSLRRRFHQFLMTSGVMNAIHSGKNTILIGALPRSGKTYVGAFLATYFKRILIITTRPGETRSQWNKVFKDHREFSAYSVRDLDSSSSAEIALSNKKGDSMVAIASIQFFKMQERDALIGLEWDLVILDEIHEGGSTELSQTMLDTYLGDSIRVMMTATYSKPVEYYSIPSDCCFFWDLEDVRLMRRWGEPEVFARLCDKYGASEVEKARDDTYASGETDESIRRCYVNAPRLGILTNMMQADLYDELRVASGSDHVYGFSMRALLMPTKDGRAFQHPRAVDTFLALLSGSDKRKHYKKGDMSMMARILRYWKTIDHRDGDEFMTQIWFLPSGVGQLLEHVKPAMIARIRANPILAQFATLTLDSGMGDISKIVANAVVDAKEQGKRGLILLTGNVGSLGVSLPEVDVAFMLHDIESADMNYQQMMRVLTEMMNKKYGIVVDFNVWRILSTLNTYATSRCGQADRSSADRIQWCVSNLIDVDPDLWECAESPETFPQEKIAEELTKQWRRMQDNCVSINKLLDTLPRTMIDLVGEGHHDLNQIAKHLAGSKGVEVKLLDSDQPPLPSGIVRKSEDDSKDGDSTDGDSADGDSADDHKDEKIKNVNLNEILARLLPEMSILSGCEYDLRKAMRAIHDQPHLLEAMNEFLIDLYRS
jgi:superfamily II DNA or RNA helicase